MVVVSTKPLVPTQNPAINKTPSQYSMSQMTENAAKQAEFNKAYAGGAASTPAPNTVPMVASRYQSYSGPDQNAGATQVNNYKVTQQSGANAMYDNLAYQKGGKRKRRKTKKNRRKRRSRTTRRRSRTMRRY